MVSERHTQREPKKLRRWLAVESGWSRLRVNRSGRQGSSLVSPAGGPASFDQFRLIGALAMDQESKREVFLLASGTMILVPLVASIAFAVFSQMH